MIWQNPWALLGVLTLTLPVFVHLLSRKRAVLQKFPSLRFLGATRLLPTRSPHLTDIPLLLVRLAILLAATLALAQPLWLSSSRKGTLNASVSRVFVIDTGAYLTRGIASGRAPADSARAVAQAMSAQSQASVIVETGTPAEALAGASAWLSAQGTRGEVVVLSDFRFGTLDSAAVARVAPSFGVQLVRVPSPIAVSNDSGFSTTAGHVVAVGDSSATRAEWNLSAGASSDSAVMLHAPANEQALVTAAARAALEIAPHSLAETTYRMAVAFDGAPERGSIVTNAKLPTQAWMASALLMVARSNVLAEAAAEAAVSDTTVAAPFAVVARTLQGWPVVYAAQSVVNGADRLVFLHRGRTSALSAPALLVAIGTTASTDAGAAGREMLTLTDAQLSLLTRPLGELGASAGGGEQAAANRAGLSDARWFWLVALLLLGLETLMRRNADAAAPAEAT
ncbi:MAG: BatA domain-containing protein [Phycisphaerae bacterium]|nr:BatA domain-containing protein [Gemmatimonadaceae bacterium]